MSTYSSNNGLGAKAFQLVACPHCRLTFRFYRSSSPHIDECGFESYSLECPRCDAPLRGIIDPADDKLLLSEPESQTKTTSRVNKLKR
jgi:hypothetical protein